MDLRFAWLAWLLIQKDSKEPVDAMGLFYGLQRWIRFRTTKEPETVLSPDQAAAHARRAN